MQLRDFIFYLEAPFRSKVAQSRAFRTSRTNRRSSCRKRQDFGAPCPSPKLVYIITITRETAIYNFKFESRFILNTLTLNKLGTLLISLQSSRVCQSAVVLLKKRLYQNCFRFAQQF